MKSSYVIFTQFECTCMNCIAAYRVVHINTGSVSNENARIGWESLKSRFFCAFDSKCCSVLALALSPFLELLRNGGVCWHDVGILFRSPMQRVGNIDCIENLVSKIEFSVSQNGNLFVPICTSTRDGCKQLIFSTRPRITILLYN